MLAIWGSDSVGALQFQCFSPTFKLAIKLRLKFLILGFKETLAKVVKFKFRLFNFEMPKILNETFQMATVLSKPSSTLTVQNVISLLKNLNLTKVQILKFRNSKLESERGSKNQLNR